MKIWGIGPVFASLSFGYALLMVSIDRYFYPYFRIEVLPHDLLVGMGISLISVGIPFFSCSLINVTKAYHSGSLVTDRVYRFCRHPLYASWVVFIVPGVVLIARSWIGMTIPIFMYIILRILVEREEAYLEARFGSRYIEYKKKVPRILPYGWIKGSGKR